MVLSYIVYYYGLDLMVMCIKWLRSYIISQQDSEGTSVSRDGKYTSEIHPDGSTNKLPPLYFE